MKIEKLIEENKEFEPLEIKLVLETPEEVRTFYHIFNNGALAEDILNNFYGNRPLSTHYSKEISNLNENYGLFRNHLNSQGYDV